MKTKMVSLGTDDLSEYDHERCNEVGVDLCIYNYSNGGYEGGGNALLRKADDRTWSHYGLSHCSCNGPLDSVGGDKGETLDALEARMSAELRGECKELFARARRYAP